MASLYHEIKNYYKFQHSLESSQDTNNDSTAPESSCQFLELDPDTQEVNIQKLSSQRFSKDSLAEAIKLVRLLIVTSFIVDRRELNDSKTRRLIQNTQLVRNNMSKNQQLVIMKEISPFVGNFMPNQAKTSGLGVKQDNLKPSVAKTSALDEESQIFSQLPNINSTHAGSFPKIHQNSFEADSSSSSSQRNKIFRLEQQVSKLLSMNEHQVSEIKDLEDDIARQKHVLDLLHYYSESSDSSESLPGTNNFKKNEYLEEDQGKAGFAKKHNDDRHRKKLTLGSKTSTHSKNKPGNDYDAVIEDLETQVASHYKSQEHLNKMAKDLSSQITALMIQDSSREKELTELKIQYSSACEKIESLRRTELTAKRYQRKIEELHDKIETLHENISILENEKKPSNSDSEFSSISEEIEDVLKKNEALQRALDESRRRESQLLALLAKLDNFDPSKLDGSNSPILPHLGFHHNTNDSIPAATSVEDDHNTHKETAPSISGTVNSTGADSSATSKSKKSVRPLIDHYEVLMKHAGFSAARWQALMNRSSSGTLGNHSGSQSFRNHTGLQRSNSIKSQNHVTAFSRRSSKDSVTSSTSSITDSNFKKNKYGDLGIQNSKGMVQSPESRVDSNASIPNEQVSEDYPNSSKKEKFGLGIEMTTSKIDLSDSKQETTKQATQINQPDIDLSTPEPTKDPDTKPSNNFDKNTFEANNENVNTVKELEERNKELRMQNHQLQQELGLMAAAWKSLASKFQDYEDHHSKSAKIDKDKLNVGQAEQNEQTASIELTTNDSKQHSQETRLVSDGSNPESEPQSKPLASSTKNNGLMGNFRDITFSRTWSWGSALMAPSKESDGDNIKSPSTKALSFYSDDSNSLKELDYDDTATDNNNHNYSYEHSHDSNSEHMISGLFENLHFEQDGTERKLKTGISTFSGSKQGSAIRALKDAISGGDNSGLSASLLASSHSNKSQPLPIRQDSSLQDQNNKGTVRENRHKDSNRKHSSKKKLHRASTMTAKEDYLNSSGLRLSSSPTWLAAQRGRVVGHTYF